MPLEHIAYIGRDYVLIQPHTKLERIIRYIVATYAEEIAESSHECGQAYADALEIVSQDSPAPHGIFTRVAVAENVVATLQIDLIGTLQILLNAQIPTLER